VPCAVTDAGDSSRIVGLTGRVVPPSDPAALAGAMRELLALPSDARRVMAHACRRRIAEEFDLDVVTRRFENLYGQMLGIVKQPAPASFSLLACPETLSPSKGEQRPAAQPLHLPRPSLTTALAS
jgi:hypothetical protein